MTPTNTANTVRLIDDSGTSYYFHDGSGTRVPYNGSNTPWTSAATSCYVLALNETDGPIWVPQPAPTIVVYGGGPPFVNGREPLYRAYDNKQDTIGVQLYANSKDNAIFLLLQLRTILNTAMFSRPCVLGVKSGTNETFVEISHADAPESALYLQEPNGVWRATITWTRQPYAMPQSLTTLLNAVTVTNTGTGANNNLRSLGAIKGELDSNQGNPMRITLASPSASGAFIGYCAIAKSRTYTASGAAISTNSTTGVDVDTAVLTAPADDEGTALRFIARIANPSASLQVRMVIKYNAVRVVATGQWQTPGAATGAYVDLGYWRIPRNLRRAKTVAIALTVQARSTSGTATGTLTYTEIVQYYTWYRASATFPSTSYSLELVGCDASVSGYAREILPPLGFLTAVPSGNVTDLIDPRGKFPRAFSGASLYLAWTFAGAHSTSSTFTVTAQHAPLYLSARGAD